MRDNKKKADVKMSREEYMSWTSYFRQRKKAIESLSDILWGFTSKECLPILNEFLTK